MNVTLGLQRHDFEGFGGKLANGLRQGPRGLVSPLQTKLVCRNCFLAPMPPMRMAAALCITVLVGISTRTHALLTRQSLINPTLSWVCRDPSSAEAQSMAALGNPSFGVSSSYDPIGILGGCMPDATCNSNGVSAWTNVFG